VNGSPVPLYSGLAAALVGVFALLVTTGLGVTVSVLILQGTGTSSDPEGTALTPGLLAAMTMLACAGLLVALVLLVTGRDAGRSALVWLALMALPWALLSAFFFTVGVDEVHEGRRAYQAARAGAGTAAGAALGLLVAAVVLGSRPARRVLSRSPASGPAPAARPRFVTGLVVVFAAGFCLLAVMPLSGMHDDPDLTAIITVLAGLHVVLISAPLLVAGLSAGTGRRGGAVVARVFSAVPLLVLPVLVVFAVFVGVTSVHNRGALLPPVVSVAASGLLTLALLAGIGLVLAGLAALADPRVRTGAHP
jgi:hypothetical protein